MPVLYCDSNLTLLSVPAGWSNDKKRCVPVPAVVVPNPTIFALTSKGFNLSFCTCIFIKSFSNLVVTSPTTFPFPAVLESTNIFDSAVVEPSKSIKTSL